nr:MAG TPA: Protein of unknown function (DUF551) [Caudoviricetes sp.]
MADRVNSLLADLRHCSGGRSCNLCNHCDTGYSACIDSLAADAADVLQEYIDRCKRYADEILALQGRCRWIPVTERLPAAGERVLAASEGVFSGEAYLSCEGVWMRSYGVVWVSLVGAPVTHWMPLPNAPEVTCDG